MGANPHLQENIRRSSSHQKKEIEVRKVVLILILVAVSSEVMAEWAPLGGGDDCAVYVDKTTIIRANNLVKISALCEYKVAQKDVVGKVFVSMRVENQFDCKNKTYRRTAASFFSKPMAQGDMVWTEGNLSQDWQPIPTNSFLSALSKISCEQA